MIIKVLLRAFEFEEPMEQASKAICRATVKSVPERCWGRGTGLGSKQGGPDKEMNRLAKGDHVNVHVSRSKSQTLGSSTLRECQEGWTGRRDGKPVKQCWGSQGH